jgi:hypothetical protein
MLETKTVGQVEISFQQEGARDLIQRINAKVCYYQSQDGAQCIIHDAAQSVKCPSHLPSPEKRYSLPNVILHTLTQLQLVHQT